MALATRPRDGSVESEAEDHRLKRVAQLAAGLVLFGLVAYAIVRDWSQVRDTLARISPGELLASELLALSGLGGSVLVWRRSLRELGSSLRIPAASKIYLVGQLGKYVPGSFWAFVIQMELARKVGVERSSSMTASVVAFAVNLVSGLAVGALILSSVGHGDAWRYTTFAVLLLVLGAALTPPVLTRLVDLVMRMLKRPRLDRPVTWTGMLVETGWALTSWLAYGLSLWIVAVAAGAPTGASLPVCLAGLALAMSAGFVVAVAPSGIGVREAVLVAALAPVLDASAALAVALVVRLVFTLADLIAAAVVLPVRLGR